MMPIRVSEFLIFQDVVMTSATNHDVHAFNLP